MVSVFLAHSPADSFSAQELGAFLEAGCDASALTQDAVIQPGEDLLSAAERGLSCDLLVLLLSPSSNPPHWPRQRWEPLLTAQASEAHTRVAIFLLDECAFPALLRRGANFFNATTDRLSALRRLKRWFRSIELGTLPAMSFSPDLEQLYRLLADRPGIATTSGPLATRFAQEAARDFEAVFWISAHRRTLAQVAGDLGSQLSMKLDRPLEDNCRQIRAVLADKRCLLLLDHPQVPIDQLLPGGRTSVLFTSEAVLVLNTPSDLATARALSSARRYAKADELFRQLFDQGIEPQSCARELAWICDHWNRTQEADAFRAHLGPSPTRQLTLF